MGLSFQDILFGLHNLLTFIIVSFFCILALMDMVPDWLPFVINIKASKSYNNNNIFSLEIHSTNKVDENPNL